MVAVAQLVRALDCGSGGRAFEPRLPPQFNKGAEMLVIKDSFSALFFAHTASHNKQHSKCILFGIFYHSTEVELIGKMYAILPLLILP